MANRTTVGSHGAALEAENGEFTAAQGLDPSGGRGLNSPSPCRFIPDLPQLCATEPSLCSLPTRPLRLNTSLTHCLRDLFVLSKTSFSQSPLGLVNIIEHWCFCSNPPSLERLR